MVIENGIALMVKGERTMPDREKVMSWLEGLAEPDWRECYSDSEVQETARQALDLIDELLKEQEAKPLRCKECSYHRNDGWCDEHRREVKESDYCSFGAWEGR